MPDPSFFSRLWSRLRGATSTLHNSPTSWFVLLALQILSLAAVAFLAAYCPPTASPSARCPSGPEFWTHDVWGLGGCSTVFCEFCDDRWLIRQPINSYSNIAFIMVGWVIVVLGVEDYRYFKRASRFSESGPAADRLTGLSSTAKSHPLQDYNSAVPPNMLMYCGFSVAHFLVIFFGSVTLTYVGVGSFIYHASMSDKGYMLDLNACYTLASMMIPYQVFNGVHVKLFRGGDRKGGDAVSTYAPLISMLFVSIGMVFSIIVPYYYWHYAFWDWAIDALVAIPILAAANFTFFFLHLTFNRDNVKIRCKADYLWMIAAIVTMGGAYGVQIGDYGALCFDHFGFMQPHAFWHSAMAIGVMFFYFFMRQERRKGAIEAADEDKSDEIEKGGGLEGQLLAKTADTFL